MEREDQQSKKELFGELKGSNNDHTKKEEETKREENVQSKDV